MHNLRLDDVSPIRIHKVLSIILAIEIYYILKENNHLPLPSTYNLDINKSTSNVSQNNFAQATPYKSVEMNTKYFYLWYSTTWPHLQ